MVFYCKSRTCIRSYLKTLQPKRDCTMPYLGLLPFLPLNAPIKKLYEVVSMPYLGLLPFLRTYSYSNTSAKEIMSMPYLGLLPFLRIQFKYGFLCQSFMSMPYLGLLPFLHKFISLLAKECKVSMPYLGLLPFLQNINSYQMAK